MKSWLIGVASGIRRMLGKHSPWTQSELARVAPSPLEIADGSVRPTAEPFTQIPFVAADGMITRRCSPWEGDEGEPAFERPHQSRVLGLVEKLPSNDGMLRSSRE